MKSILKQEIARVIIFVLFFTIGAASLSASVLCEDLARYFQNRQLTESTKVTIARLKSLNADYDELLSNLNDDPNYVKRLAPFTLGTSNQAPDAIYPKLTAEQLAAARKALVDPNQESEKIIVPAWLNRCSEPQKRITLFISGIVLILISFICFRPASAAS
jgi:hypothetical protein